MVAPFAGIVGSRQISPGQVITRNSTLTWLVDLDTVKVEVKVPERYLRQLQVGQPLEFTVAAFPDETRHLQADRIRAARTFGEFDGCVTAPLHGFASAEDYYTRSSSVVVVGRKAR